MPAQLFQHVDSYSGHCLDQKSFAEGQVRGEAYFSSFSCLLSLTQSCQFPPLCSSLWMKALSPLWYFPIWLQHPSFPVSLPFLPCFLQSDGDMTLFLRRGLSKRCSFFICLNLPSRHSPEDILPSTHVSSWPSSFFCSTSFPSCIGLPCLPVSLLKSKLEETCSP